MLTNARIFSLRFVGEFGDMELHKELQRIEAILMDVCANACGNVAYFRVQVGRDGPKHGAILFSAWICQSPNAQVVRTKMWNQ